MLNDKNNALKLWAMMVGGTVFFLVLVMKDQPFVDSQGAAGLTMGDKAQVVTQFASLAQYAMAGALIVATAADNEDMLTTVGVVAVVVMLASLVLPILYMRAVRPSRHCLGLGVYSAPCNRRGHCLQRP
eukprot:COSAG05_NODE_1876_length_3913_cov_86.680126_2_plen_129_part_00